MELDLNFDNIDDVLDNPKPTSGSFKPTYLKPGARIVKIVDFDGFVTQGGSMAVSMLVEDADEEVIKEIGEDGVEFGGLLGEHKAKGSYGKVLLTWISADKTKQAVGVKALRSDISKIAEITGTLEDLKKLKIDKNDDPNTYILSLLKAVAKIFNGKKIATILAGEQSIKGDKTYEQLVAKRGWVTVDKFEKKQPTALSCYDPDKVVEIIRDGADNQPDVKHVMSIEDESGIIVKHTYNKFIPQPGKICFDYKWAEIPDSDEGMSKGDDSSDSDELSDFGGSDDLPF